VNFFAVFFSGWPKPLDGQKFIAAKKNAAVTASRRLNCEAGLIRHFAARRGVKVTIAITAVINGAVLCCIYGSIAQLRPFDA
jgi:hypothetical protein